MQAARPINLILHVMKDVTDSGIAGIPVINRSLKTAPKKKEKQKRNKKIKEDQPRLNYELTAVINAG